MAKRPDEDLILYFYGEHPAPDELARELATDPELARRNDALRRELRTLDGLTVPEPRPGLEARMWARVSPSLTRPSRRFALPSGWLGWASLATGVLVIALSGFLAGRGLHEMPTETAVAETLRAMPPAARDRVLRAALVDHLDASQRLMLEVANGAASLDDERASAQTLLSENRLYRRAAEAAGRRRVAVVLGELEPFLAQLADAPTSFDLRRSRERIENADLLFKVRITRNNLKELS